MAVATDWVFLKTILEANILESPCLEIGSAFDNSKSIIEEHGLSYKGADIKPGDDVDYVIDFCEDDIRRHFDAVYFKTIIVFNVLEHVYNPVKFLDNAFSVLAAGGKLLIITPLVWDIHDYPKDYWRINPDFYIDYCLKNDLKIIDDYFAFITAGKILPIYSCAANGQKRLPTTRMLYGWRCRYSEAIHNIFKTSGRWTRFVSTSVGLVIEKP